MIGFHYEEYDGGMVYLSDGSVIRIVGHGRVLIIFLDGRVKGVNGFLNILGLEQNLLLVRKLNDVGEQVVLCDKGCTMV
jgi:hypothetical protein